MVTGTLVSTEGMVRVERAPGSIDSKKSHEGQTRGRSMHAASPSTGFSWLSGRLLVKTGTASLPTVAPIPTNMLSIFSTSLGHTRTTDHRLDTFDSQKLPSAPFGDQGDP